MNPALGALRGRRIINTRAAEQAAGLSDALRAVGAVAVEIPMIEIIQHRGEMERLTALGAQLHRFSWLVVTSPNGAGAVVEAFGPRLASATVRLKIAAVGRATAEALGHPVELIPAQSNGHGLIAEFPRGAGEVLVVQSGAAAPTVVDGLAGLGWTVTAVAPHRAAPVTPTAEQRQAARRADALVLASGSAARSWAASMADLTPAVVVAIGPQCAAAAAQRELVVTAVAERFDIPGVVATLTRLFEEGFG